MEKFAQRKKEILNKLDKSSKGDWDKKIVGLCDKINASENCYTTSSCAGRVVLLLDSEKKKPDLFRFVNHDLIFLDELKSELGKIEGDAVFKQEPCILHLACRDLDSAREIYDKAKLLGWKRSGLISWEKNFILELNSTEKIELPIVEGGKILVDDDFLEILVERANRNLKKSWGKIEKLEKLI